MKTTEELSAKWLSVVREASAKSGGSGEGMAPALASKVLFLSMGAVKPSASENLFGVASHPLEKPLDRESVRQRVRELVARARPC